MSATQWQIGPAQSREELEAFADILTRSLFFPSLEEFDWLDTEGRDAFRLVRRGERVVGGYTVQEMGQWFGGVSIPLGAVRCVGIAPDMRGQGASTAMLTSMLHELHQKGLPLAALYPSTMAVYRKVGFEQAGTCFGYVWPTQEMPLTRSSVTLRDVSSPTSDDLEAMVSMYREWACRQHGLLDRSEWFWQQRLFSSRRGGLRGYILSDAGRDVGYVLYTQRFERNCVDGEFHIRDMVYLTEDAMRALLTFFGQQRSTIQRIHWCGPASDMLLASLPNPHLDYSENWRWLLRLIDVVSAIEQRRFFGGLSLSVELAIRDELLAHNDGSFVLKVSEGRATMKRGGSGLVKVGVRALASMYSGFRPAKALRLAGMLEGPDEQIAALDALFAGPEPWMPDMF